MGYNENKEPVYYSIIISRFAFTSCSPRLTGNWNVENFETIRQNERIASATNIGTTTFRRNGTGSKELSFTILGVSKEDKSPFTWTANNNLVTIQGENSDFAKTWIIVEQKMKYKK